MKKVKIFLAVALCAWALTANISCKAKNEKKEVATQAVDTAKVEVKEHNADELKERVENIYQQVAAAYNKCNQGDGLDLTPLQEANLDEKFCSDDWNATVAKVNEFDMAHEGEMGFFEADYWIAGQDFQDISVSDVKVEKIEGDKAVVTMKLHNMGEAIAEKLDMVFERDNWFIDNFTEEHKDFPGEPTSWKNAMKEYLKENQNKKFIVRCDKFGGCSPNLSHFLRFVATSRTDFSAFCISMTGNSLPLQST